jgi:hypothetical protein
MSFVLATSRRASLPFSDPILVHLVFVSVSPMSMRTSLTVSSWAWLSVGAAACVAVSALSQRPNFFSAALYVARSNACTMALWNAGVFATFLLGRLFQVIFFGPLRTIEVEVSCCSLSIWTTRVSSS